MTIAAFAVSPSDLRASSENLLKRPRGRLSTQKKPRSSRARRNVPFPEPLKPVMMMKEDGCMEIVKLDKSPSQIRNPKFGIGPSNLRSRISDLRWAFVQFQI